MQSFKDASGRTWDLKIDVAAIQRVHRLCGVDLTDRGALTEALQSGPVLLHVIYVLCKPEADRLGIDEDGFGAGLDSGDVVEQATDAFVEALVNFTRSRDRPVLTRILEKVRARQEQASADLENRLASGEIDRMIDQALSGTSSDAAPAASASTPGR